MLLAGDVSSWEGLQPLYFSPGFPLSPLHTPPPPPHTLQQLSQKADYAVVSTRAKGTATELLPMLGFPLLSWSCPGPVHTTAPTVSVMSRMPIAVSEGKLELTSNPFTHKSSAAGGWLADQWGRSCTNLPGRAGINQGDSEEDGSLSPEIFYHSNLPGSGSWRLAPGLACVHPTCQ